MNADVVIAESTLYSAGLGFLIATAVNERKHVLCLEDIESDEEMKGSGTLQAAESNMLTYKKYNTVTLKRVLTDYLEDVKGRLDTKFILIISPEIDKFLKWASYEYRLHKSQIVRDAIEDIMKNDENYQKYLRKEE